MWRYITLLSFESVAVKTQWREGVKQGANPRDVKVKLALELVTRFHSASDGKRAHDDFVARFQQHMMPQDVPLQTLDINAPDLLLTQLLKQVGLVSSTSEAIRCIRQGGVKIDGQKVDGPHLRVQKGSEHIYQVGKRRFARVKLDRK